MGFLIWVSKKALKPGIIPQNSPVAFEVNSKTIRVSTVFKGDAEDGSG